MLGLFRRPLGTRRRALPKALSFLETPPLAGPSFWVRADLGVTLNGTRVSNLADQSGTGDSNKHLSQTDAARQPLYNASDGAYNGKPTLTLALARKDTLKSAAWSSALAQPLTVGWVGNVGNGTNYVLFERLAARMGLITWWGPSALEMYADVDPDVYKRAILPAQDWPSMPSIVIAVFTNTTSTLYLNKRTARATVDGAHGGAGALGIDGVRIGISYDDLSWPLDGKFVEMAIWPFAANASQRAALWDSWSARYSITVGA